MSKNEAVRCASMASRFGEIERKECQEQKELVGRVENVLKSFAGFHIQEYYLFL